MPIIAISGPHGSGKSTAARTVAELLSYTYVSAGQLFREMAKEKGLTIEALSKLAETDNEIDTYIDNKTVELAQVENGIIVDAQLGGWVLRKVADLIIYITAPVKTRIQRIAEREDRSIEEIKKETLMREESERDRYQKLYNINISDLSIYDVIINTKKYDAAECVDIIMASVKKITKGE